MLPPVLAGEKISALAITEPSGGSDVAHLRTRARRDGDDLSSTARRRSSPPACAPTSTLPCAPAARVWAASPAADRRRHAGPVAHPAEEDGLVGIDTATLYFDDCRVPAENLIGEESQASRASCRTSTASGSAWRRAARPRARLHRGSAAYAQERQTFGKPLAQHQVIRHKLVDMAQKRHGLRRPSRNAGMAHRTGRHPSPSSAC